MQFKYPQLQAEYKKIDQRTQNALQELDNFSQANALPEPIITHVHRTLQQSEEIYWKVELVEAKSKGATITEAEARTRARKRFSFHMVDTACDLRDYIYTPTQLTLVLSCLRAGRQDGNWEVLGHDVGSGHHLHIAYRNMELYNDWRKVNK